MQSLSGAGLRNGRVGWSGGFLSGKSCGPVGYRTKTWDDVQNKSFFLFRLMLKDDKWYSSLDLNVV